jgi:hemolysin III
VPPGSFATSSVTTSGNQHRPSALAPPIKTPGDTRPTVSPVDQTGCWSDGCPGGLVLNYDRTELLSDGIVHAIGLALAILGVATIISLSWPLTFNVKMIAVLIYAGGLVAMLGLSAAYNLWPVSPWKWRLRRLDHSAIFIFIAAIYTPLIAHLKADIGTVCTLVGVWIVAIFGVLLKVFLPGRFDRLSIGLCLLLGSSGLLLFEPALGTHSF